jgi:hypothetical protein
MIMRKSSQGHGRSPGLQDGGKGLHPVCRRALQQERGLAHAQCESRRTSEVTTRPLDTILLITCGHPVDHTS